MTTSEISDLAAAPVGNKLLPRLRVENTSGVGFKTKIFIDEQDVSECFTDVKVAAGIKGAVVVELEAVAAECFIDGRMQLQLPGAGTRELLIKHGWTPPTTDDDGDV